MSFEFSHRFEARLPERRFSRRTIQPNAAVEQAARYRDLRRLLICIVFYQAGIQTVIALAAIYAQQALGFSTQDTIVLILIVNVTAAVGAFAFGHVQDRLGHIATVAPAAANTLAKRQPRPDVAPVTIAT